MVARVSEQAFPEWVAEDKALSSVNSQFWIIWKDKLHFISAAAVVKKKLHLSETSATSVN